MPLPDTVYLVAVLVIQVLFIAVLICRAVKRDGP